VLNDRLDKQCRVEVSLLDDVTGVPHVVARWRKWKAGKDGGRATNGVMLDGNQAMDEAETTRQIEQVLGITHAIWCRGVVFGQESGFNFCDATAMQRQDILTTVLGLEVVDVWHEKCRDEKRALTNRLAEVDGRLTVHRAALESANQVNLQAAVDEWEKGRTAQLAWFDTQVATAETTGKGLKAQLAAIVIPAAPEASQAPQQAPWQEPPDLQADPAFHQRWEYLLAEERQAARAANEVGAAKQAAETAVRGVQQVLGNALCPTCWQSITEEHKARCLGEARAVLEALIPKAAAADAAFTAASLATTVARDATRSEEQRVAMARAQIGQARAAHAAQARAQDQQWRAEVQLRGAARETALREQAALEGQIEKVRGDWRTADTQRVKLRAEVNPYLAAVTRHAATLVTLAANLAAAEADQAAIAKALAVCLWWDRELPRFKTWMFDSVVDILAAEANRWLRIMSGGVIWIQITTQKEVAKRMKDEVDVQIYRWNPDGTMTCRPYRLWSGGEKRRVALAVDLGLSRLLASRASKAYRFAALDEIDRHLDDKGREGLRQVLDELRNEKDTCAVISHDRDFKASFDNEILVTRQAGTTRMDIHATR
jgi:DNA repair exonuclease SbcCD ATPase subunit